MFTVGGICPKGSCLFKKKTTRNLAARRPPQASHGLRASALLRTRRCVLLPARALAVLRVPGTNPGFLLCPGKLDSQRLRLTRVGFFLLLVNRIFL